MRSSLGRVTEVQLDIHQTSSVRIECPPGAIPAAGQYLLACDPAERAAPLAVPLFLGEALPAGFWAAPPAPATWGPGVRLELRGPLGKGFHLPDGLRRLACATLGPSIARLMPLARAALAQNADVALFTDAPVSRLPASLEVSPLSALPESLAWPDLLALDLPLERLPGLRADLHLDGSARLPCPAQALIETPMPCGSAGECGACAVPLARQGWALACKDGPVFDLRDLKW